MTSELVRKYRMPLQPTWPERTPDKLTDITGGGFVDGNGQRHFVPVGLSGLNVSLEKGEDGRWQWVGSPKNGDA